jgi:hypothetical protein
MLARRCTHQELAGAVWYVQLVVLELDAVLYFQSADVHSLACFIDSYVGIEKYASCITPPG